MNKREMVCIVCPHGCNMKVEKEGEEVKVLGNSCERGYDFAKQEITEPKRMITTTVKINSKTIPTLPVVSSGMLNKVDQFEVIKIIKATKVMLPIKKGDIVVKNIMNSGINIISCIDVEG